MSFKLQVELSGVCLYVVHPQGQQVAVLIPDARISTNPNLFHLDDTEAEPHVGYLRIDLADVCPALPRGVSPKPGDAPEPKYELVHRFDRQVLTFEGYPEFAEPDPYPVSLAFPSFKRIAPELDLLPGLFGPRPPAALLMRMILDGGKWVTDPTDETWKFSQALNPGEEEFADKFASFATWTRAFRGDSLTVRVSDFAGNPEASFPMHGIPEGAVISVKIANLCAENPLEWSDLPFRQVKGDDNDFKWLYRLLQPPEGDTIPALLKSGAAAAGRGRAADPPQGGDPPKLPAPHRTEADAATGADDCIGGVIPKAFP